MARKGKEGGTTLQVAAEAKEAIAIVPTAAAATSDAAELGFKTDADVLGAAGPRAQSDRCRVLQKAGGDWIAPALRMTSRKSLEISSSF